MSNENYNNNNIPEEEDSFFSDDVMKGLFIVLGIIGLFVLGYSLLTNDGGTPSVAEPSTSVVYESQLITQAPVVNTTSAPATNVIDSTAAGDTVDTTAAPFGTPTQMTTAEIVALFNESANKVKTDAVKVVKNFEHRQHNEDKLVLPSALEGMFNSLMSENMTDDTVPIEYPTREEIIFGYPVPGESWSSQLTEAEVAEASCTDNGTEYELMIKLHPSVNPEPGTGTAKVFDCITSSEVSASAPSFVEDFSTEYYDCVVRCRIDKATGRTVWSNYTSPVVIKVLINMGFTKLDAQVGMSFEKDYSITY